MSRSVSSNYHWKRKRNHQDRSERYQDHEDQFYDRQRELAALHIQAHEADIVHGTEAKNRARMLEVDAFGKPGPQTSLLKLETKASASAGWNADEDNVFSLSGSNARPKQVTVAAQEVWVDRYVGFSKS